MNTRVKEFLMGFCRTEFLNWRSGQNTIDVLFTLNGEDHHPSHPALYSADGYKEWKRWDLHHREGGPAIIFSNGEGEWWVDGKLHRIDGPAIDYDGCKEWYIRGEIVIDERKV